MIASEVKKERRPLIWEIVRVGLLGPDEIIRHYCLVSDRIRSFVGRMNLPDLELLEKSAL